MKCGCCGTRKTTAHDGFYRWHLWFCSLFCYSRWEKRP